MRLSWGHLSARHRAPRGWGAGRKRTGPRGAGRGGRQRRGCVGAQGGSGSGSGGGGEPGLSGRGRKCRLRSAPGSRLRRGGVRAAAGRRCPGPAPGSSAPEAARPSSRARRTPRRRPEAMSPLRREQPRDPARLRRAQGAGGPSAPRADCAGGAGSRGHACAARSRAPRGPERASAPARGWAGARGRGVSRERARRPSPRRGSRSEPARGRAAAEGHAARPAPRLAVWGPRAEAPRVGGGARPASPRKRAGSGTPLPAAGQAEGAVAPPGGLRRVFVRRRPSAGPAAIPLSSRGTRTPVLPQRPCTAPSGPEEQQGEGAARAWEFWPPGLRGGRRGLRGSVPRPRPGRVPSRRRQDVSASPAAVAPAPAEHMPGGGALARGREPVEPRSPRVKTVPRSTYFYVNIFPVTPTLSVAGV